MGHTQSNEAYEQAHEQAHEDLKQVYHLCNSAFGFTKKNPLVDLKIEAFSKPQQMEICRRLVKNREFWNNYRLSTFGQYHMSNASQAFLEWYSMVVRARIEEVLAPGVQLIHFFTEVIITASIEHKTPAKFLNEMTADMAFYVKDYSKYGRSPLFDWVKKTFPNAPSEVVEWARDTHYNILFR